MKHGRQALNQSSSIFRAFNAKNYRIFFFGQSISLIGTWMQQIAMSWLVYRLSGSAFLLGIVGFTGRIPIFILASVGGVISDCYDRKRILILIQMLAMIQAFVLAALVFSGAIAIWHLVGLSIMLGILNAFEIPTRQSFVIEMVEKPEYLGNAIALNSSMFNAARLIGPSLAGVLIATLGEGVCFILNGISFLTVILALFAMNVVSRSVKIRSERILQGFKEGFFYTFEFLPRRYTLMLLALVSLMATPYQVLMPVFAEEILQGGPKILGFLMGASGIGALSGALYLASRRSLIGTENKIPLAAIILGVGLIAFSFSRYLWLSLFCMIFVGFGTIVQAASSNILLQTISDDDKRGRVMSFYAMAFMGTMPFGSLLAGSLASIIGAANTLLIGSSVCILGALLFAFKLPSIQRMIVSNFQSRLV